MGTFDGAIRGSTSCVVVVGCYDTDSSGDFVSEVISEKNKDCLQKKNLKVDVLVFISKCLCEDWEFVKDLIGMSPIKRFLSTLTVYLISQVLFTSEQPKKNKMASRFK